MRHTCRPRGLTLLELVIALCIATGLTLLAGASYNEFMALYRLRSQAQALASALRLAQSEAVKRGLRVNVCKSLDRLSCADDGGYETGWLLHVDIGGQGQPDADEGVLRFEPPAPPGMTIRGNGPVSDFVSYTPLGHARRLNGALQMGTFTLCSPGQSAVEVILAHSGRVRIVGTSTPCG